MGHRSSMIKLKQLISEGKKVKYNFRNVLPGGIDASVDVEFSVMVYDNRFIFLPKTSKDLDKIETLNLDRSAIEILLENRVNDKLKGIELTRDKTYQGAGYALILDLNQILNKLK
jgi:tricorn protease-like protein